jgi:hypothetical protein
MAKCPDEKCGNENVSASQIDYPIKRKITYQAYCRKCGNQGPERKTPQLAMAEWSQK